MEIMSIYETQFKRKEIVIFSYSGTRWFSNIHIHTYIFTKDSLATEDGPNRYYKSKIYP